MSTSVVVVDDQQLVRQGICTLLSLSSEVDVVGEAADGQQALDVVAASEPDVVLLDLRMPIMNGICVLRELRGKPPALVLTTFDDDDDVLTALRLGARGYLLKDVALGQLVAAIETVAAGGTAVQPGITTTLLRRVWQQPATRDQFDRIDRPPGLTGRELDVLALVASGFANREIAVALHLTEGTVKNYMSSVLDKLGVRDRTRAALRALELGLFGRSDQTRISGREPQS